MMAEKPPADESLLNALKAIALRMGASEDEIREIRNADAMNTFITYIKSEKPKSESKSEAAKATDAKTILNKASGVPPAELQPEQKPVENAQPIPAGRVPVRNSTELLYRANMRANAEEQIPKNFDLIAQGPFMARPLMVKKEHDGFTYSESV